MTLRQSTHPLPLLRTGNDLDAPGTLLKARALKVFHQHLLTKPFQVGHPGTALFSLSRRDHKGKCHDNVKLLKQRQSSLVNERWKSLSANSQHAQARKSLVIPYKGILTTHESAQVGKVHKILPTKVGVLNAQGSNTFQALKVRSGPSPPGVLETIARNIQGLGSGKASFPLRQKRHTYALLRIIPWKLIHLVLDLMGNLAK